MFDNTETDSLELLRFYPSLTAIAGFEDALHERVRQVGRIPDHAFPLIVAVERLEGDGALALVSTHTAGKRLSTFFDKPGPRRGLNPAFVTGIVTQVIQALTVLQSKGDDITHSAITPDRLVVSTGGRICVVEHVLGLALRQLNLSASQLWREFGLVSAPTITGAVCLDARTDVFQLGVLAIEMLLGRRLSPLDLKDRLPDLLDQWSDVATRAGLASDRLRLWLERALQLGSRTYATAADAYSDLRDMPSESAASVFESLPAGTPRGMPYESSDVESVGKRAHQPAKLTAGQDSLMANVPSANGSAASDDFPVIPAPPVRSALMPTESHWADTFLPESKPAAAAALAAPRGREAAAAEPAPHVPPPAAPVAPRSVTPSSAVQHTPHHTPGNTTSNTTSNTAPRRTSFKAPRVSPWIAAALGGVTLLEGVVIAALLIRQPAGGPAATPPVSPIPAAVVHDAAPPPITPPAAVSDQKPAAPSLAPVDPIKLAASNQRSGGIRFQSAVELNVLQGEKVLGSTAAGPIVATAGTYQLDLINTSLGIKLRQSVTFRAGEITKLDVAIPPGRLSLNAQPWANVTIDGKPSGETPLANLSVPVGEHEVVFRNPDLGERRVTVTVRADQPARTSVSFER